MKKIILSLLVAVGLTSFAGSAKAQSYNFTTLDNPLALLGTEINGISADGTTIFGSYAAHFHDTIYYSWQGFTEQGGIFTTVNNPLDEGGGTHITGVSGNMLVGYYGNNSNGNSSFTEVGGVFNAVNYPLGGPTTEVDGISADGSTIYGYHVDDSNNLNGFTETRGVFTVVNYPESIATMVTGVFGSTMVGWYQANGTVGSFTKTRDVFTPFNYPGSVETVVRGISADGSTIYGYHADGNNTGFTESGGVFNSWNIPGSQNTQITGVSGNMIVGTYQTSDGIVHGFTGSLSSVPEPSTYALFGIGAIGMLVVIRRKKTA